MLSSFSSSLQQEELKKQYLTEQVGLIISIRDTWNGHQQGQGNGDSPQIMSPHMEGVETKSSPSTMLESAYSCNNNMDEELFIVELLMEKSTLVNELRGVYHGLIGPFLSY